MDLQTRKLNLITYLLQMKDEVFFDKLENYILKNEAELNTNISPFSAEELINRVKKSELDFENGNFKSQEDVESISSNW
ncbi:MAG: hypothetical protein ACOVLC_03960 [Flavobacterium sp.]